MRRIIETLEKYDSNLTISQLSEIIKTEQKNKKIEEERCINTIKEKFKGIYLKRKHENSFFGKSLEVYYSESITDVQRTDRWELVYFIKGEKVAFSVRDISFVIIPGTDTYFSFTEEELNDMEIITKEEYDSYKLKYNRLFNELTSIIS